METSLIGPENAQGFPAPYWFLVLFKVLGMVLHMVPMHLWFAGLIVMLLLRRRGGEHAARLSDRTLNALPVIVACGVNLGIVPLLFTQVAYYQAFYPAGVLMAWPWLSVILLLTVAYYGVYFYAFGLRDGRLTLARRAGGWAAAVLFLVMGFLFTNYFSLMSNVGAWRGLWAATSVGGAPTGTALNTGDPTLWPRWLLMFGLALQTTAVWALFDGGVFAGRESAAYRRWAAGWAVRLHAAGLVWFAAAGSWYVFGTLAPAVRERLLAGPQIALTALTAAGPGLIWLLLLLGARRAASAPDGGAGRGFAIVVFTAHFLVLGLNAVSRQLVQNWELRPHLDAAAGKVVMQWSPLILFLLLFVAGVGLVIWMLRQAVRAAGKPAAG